MNKKNKGIIISLIIAIAIIFALSGFIIYDKFIKENTKNETSEKNLVTEDEKKELINIINELRILDEYNHNIDNNKPLTNTELLAMAYMNIKNKRDDNWHPEFDEIKKYIETYMGILVEPEDIKFYKDINYEDIPSLYIYDKKTKEYIYNKNYPASGYLKIDTYDRIDEFKKTKDIYEVIVYKAYGHSDGFFGSDRVYGNFNDANSDNKSNKLFDVIWESNEKNKVEMVTDLKAELNKISNDKLTKITYTFEKENYNFIFKSYTID